MINFEPNVYIFLPKLHKKPVTVCPIVSCCLGPTGGVSAYLDFFFQPLMNSISSYLASSIELINTLTTSHFSSDCFLVTLDVSSLYTNISHEVAVDTIFHIFSHIPPSPYIPPIFILIELLIFVLKNNIFSFNQEFFIQLHGIAMGTKLAPSLATLFLPIIEDEYINTSTIKPSPWCRYIDDIFFVWEDSRETLDMFIAGLNSLKPRLKFTAEISSTSVTFLDLSIREGPDFSTTGLFDTDISYKPTNHFSYIHGTSHHPRHTFKAIGISESVRILRACCSQVDFQKHQSNLIKRLRIFMFSQKSCFSY